MHRRITRQHCEIIDNLSIEELGLEKRRSRFILQNKFRSLAGEKRLGVFWIFLEPLVMSLVYLFVLTVLRSSLSPESIFIGITLWGIVSVSIISGLESIGDYSGGLRCERVRTSVLVRPMIQYRIIDSIARSLAVSFILLIYYGISVIGFYAFLISSIFLGLLSEGLALNLSRLVHRIEDIKIIIRYFLRLMFFVSPVLYPLSFAEGLHLSVNLLNPFSYFSEFTRYLSGLESAYSTFEVFPTISLVGVFVALSIRGYSRIDRLRWEMSSWS